MSLPNSRRNRLTELGELQLQVLDILAQRESATVYDVLEAFPDAQRPRYTTVLTVLRALEDKGLAMHEEQGHAYLFRATPQAGSVRQTLLSDLLGKAFNNSPRDLVATLLDTDAVTPEVLQELKRLISESEG